MSDGRGWNSTLRSVSKKKQAAIDSGAYKRAPRKPMKAKAATNEGWYNWAVENVWNKREHVCEACGASLGGDDNPPPALFSHLLPRGSYRKYKCDERNVILNCVSCHAEWHEYGHDALFYNTIWNGIVNKYIALRNEANGVR